MFISSTSDLASEREAVAAALRPTFDPYLYEQEPAQSRSPEERCRQMIHAADFFVGLLGEHYGTPFPAAGKGHSIVEWEFQEARAQAGLPVLAFLKHIPDPQAIDPRQRQVLQRLTGDFQKALWSKAFASTAELVKLVKDSLAAWFVEFWVREKETRHAFALPRLRLFIAIATATILALAGVTLTSLSDAFSNASLLALCGAGGGIVLLCLVLTLVELGGHHGKPSA